MPRPVNAHTKEAVGREKTQEGGICFFCKMSKRPRTFIPPLSDSKHFLLSNRQIFVCVCIKSGATNASPKIERQNTERERRILNGPTTIGGGERSSGASAHTTHSPDIAGRAFFYGVWERDFIFFSICLKFLDPEWKRSQQQNKTKTQSENISH